MTKQHNFELIKRFEENGFTLALNLAFTDNGDGTMQLLQCTITNGYEAIDYESVVDTTTLLQVIKDLMH